MSKQSLYLALGVATLLAAVLGAFGPLRYAFSQPDLYPWGDDAVTETYVRFAAEGKLLTGAYSRYGWHHPGPAFFYLAVPLYKATGGRSISLYLTALLFNVTMLLGIIGLVYGSAPDDAPHWTFFTMFILFLGVFAPHILMPWNPNVIQTPACLLLFACAALAMGRVVALPVVVFAASFGIQGHVGLAPIALPLMAAAIAVFAWRWRKERDSANAKRHLWPWVSTSVAIGFVMWLPPVLDEFFGSRNLSKVFSFFRQYSQWHPFRETYSAVAAHLATPFLMPFGASAKPAAAGIVTTAFIAALAAAMTAAIWRRRPYAFALCAASLLTIALTMLFTARIVGPIFPYMLYWTSAATIAGGAGIAGVLPPIRRKAVSIASIVAISAITVVSLIRIASAEKHFLPYLLQAEVAQTSERLRAHLKERGIDCFEAVSEREVGSFANALILQAYKQGLCFSVMKDWDFVYGRIFPAPKEPAPYEVLVATRPKDGSEYVLISQGRFLIVDFFVYGRSMK